MLAGHRLMGDGGRSEDTRGALPWVRMKCAEPPRWARARFDSAPLFSQNIRDDAKESCQKKLILVNVVAQMNLSRRARPYEHPFGKRQALVGKPSRSKLT